MAWFGPAIGSDQFEVGPEVRQAFINHGPQASSAFTSRGARPGHYMADIYQLARQRLQQAGVSSIGGGGLCTVSDAQRFYSFRRDGQTGRMATLIAFQ
jgi:copper oxidase (laccase) domain-containing protein